MAAVARAAAAGHKHLETQAFIALDADPGARETAAAFSPQRAAAGIAMAAAVPSSVEPAWPSRHEFALPPKDDAVLQRDPERK